MSERISFSSLINSFLAWLHIIIHLAYHLCVMRAFMHRSTHPIDWYSPQVWALLYIEGIFLTTHSVQSHSRYISFGIISWHVLPENNDNVSYQSFVVPGMTTHSVLLSCGDGALTQSPTDVINIDFCSDHLRISQPGLNFCVTLSALHKSELLKGFSGLRTWVCSTFWTRR